MKKIFLIMILMTIWSCTKKDGFVSDNVGGNQIANGCEGAAYPNWETSKHVLPYPVGQSYSIGLSHCSGTPHIEGLPDQFAIDINMNVGTLVTASRKGTIMFVEESGLDYELPNNIVVLRDEDGYFLQYHHLTNNGSIVEQGQFVEKGDPIGYSGASGEAGYPHLHFVASRGGFEAPYMSYPITFSNTSANPFSLIQGQTYEALPY
ncbi:MAG: M23 family metallopeptidase [Bacteroidia bacterium]|nr:M23 family metallopeptidase [Bacteroidia bacterium]NND25040.1 M23 family metallopeptidase [Flavobacteriaceae bacterium]NNL33786.1 M23 family metallopeptidase [Flavobacteriaceae bacterium]